MQVKVRTFAACALLVLLLVPAAAGASKAEVTGPLTLGGKGFFGGELKLELGEGQRPVRIAGRIGYVGFLDLGGDLKVRCLGRGRVAKHETEQGMVYLCKGRAGQAVVLGSHFTFRGFAKRFRIHLPEGASGTLSGRFVMCSEGACARAGANERQAERKSKLEERKSKLEKRKAKLEERKAKLEERKAKKEQGEQSEPNPTLADVAAALAATG